MLGAPEPRPGEPRLSRREVLRVGGSTLLGFTLADLLALQARAAPRPVPSEAGWGRAKGMILLYLQGGPSHLDLWDPKENCPADVQSIYKKIATNVDGI